MGQIVGMKTITREKVHVQVEMSPLEALWLKGNLEDVYVFSKRTFEEKSRLVQRGKKESSKYLLLPKLYRKGVVSFGDVPCQGFESGGKLFVVYELTCLPDLNE
ncbi:hypothetical protein H6501_05725 [Candidatus Woesearchaeota archaeon]|nr:hypothetical protein [Nanoarchaeota archaeon]MCB9371072.1 hypothetical protein [Candidatus Woesearchaeota archaeon]USN44211.1 MAG: hypothetical protein H6500_07525 [Candidatus Woesearchaeota archaeon]